MAEEQRSQASAILVEEHVNDIYGKNFPVYVNYITYLFIYSNKAWYSKNRVEAVDEQDQQG